MEASKSEAQLSAATQLLLGSNSYPSDEAYSAKILERIQELERETHLLKVRRNQSLPYPNRLLPEVLSLILYPEQWSPFHCSKVNEISWISGVTHVCQYWRKVALGCPILWSDLSFVHPELAEIMLERSNNAPLLVAFSSTLATASLHDVLSKALRQSDRLRIVAIKREMGGKFDLGTLLADMGTKAPMLQELLLLDSKVTGNRLPWAFALGSAPLLTRLELAGVVFQWERLPRGSSLTRLTLKRHMLSSRPSWNDFYGALGEMPRLKYLDLRDLLPAPRQSTSKPTSKRVYLRALESVTVSDETVTITNFLRSISILKTAMVDLWLTDSAESMGLNVDACVVSMKAAWADDPFPWKKIMVSNLHIFDPGSEAGFLNGPNVQLTLEIPDERSLAEVGMDEQSFGEHLLLDEHIFFTLNTRHTHCLSAFFASLMKHFDFSSVAGMQIYDGTIPSYSSFRDTLSTLPNVRTLQLSHTPIHVFVDVLATDPGLVGREPSSRKPHHFPALEEISLFGVDFGDTGIQLDRLVAALQRRPQDRRISSFCAEESRNFDDGDVATMQDALPDVYIGWDEG